MPNPVTGSGGSVTIDATAIGKVTDWEYSEEFDTEEQGPWIGEPDKIETPGGATGELTVNCQVPEGGDSGQNAVIAAKGTRADFVLTTDLGKIVTITDGLVKSFTLGTEASGTQAFSFVVGGVAVVSQDS